MSNSVYRLLLICTRVNFIIVITMNWLGDAQCMYDVYEIIKLYLY